MAIVDFSVFSNTFVTPVQSEPRCDSATVEHDIDRDELREAPTRRIASQRCPQPGNRHPHHPLAGTSGPGSPHQRPPKMAESLGRSRRGTVGRIRRMLVRPRAGTRSHDSPDEDRRRDPRTGSQRFDLPHGSNADRSTCRNHARTVWPTTSSRAVTTTNSQLRFAKSSALNTNFRSLDRLREFFFAPADVFLRAFASHRAPRSPSSPLVNRPVV